MVPCKNAGNRPLRQEKRKAQKSHYGFVFLNFSFYPCFKKQRSQCLSGSNPLEHRFYRAQRDFKNCNLLLSLTCCLYDLLNLANSSWLAL